MHFLSIYFYKTVIMIIFKNINQLKQPNHEYYQHLYPCGYRKN